MSDTQVDNSPDTQDSAQGSYDDTSSGVDILKAPDATALAKINGQQSPPTASSQPVTPEQSELTQADRDVFAKDVADRNTPINDNDRANFLSGMKDFNRFQYSWSADANRPYPLTDAERQYVSGTPTGRVAEAFGTAFYDSMKENTVDSDEVKQLKSAGLDYKNYMSKKDMWDKSFTDGFLIPAAKTTQAVVNASMANVSAGVATVVRTLNPINQFNAFGEGLGAATTQAGKEVDATFHSLYPVLFHQSEQNQLAEESFPLAMQAFPDTELLGILPGHGFAEAVNEKGFREAAENQFVGGVHAWASLDPSNAGMTAEHPLMQTIMGTKANGAMERQNGEAIRLGLKEPSEQQMSGMQAAADSLPKYKFAFGRGLTPAGPSVHDVARTIDPEAFRQYDNLTTHVASYGQWLQDLGAQRKAFIEDEANQPHTAEIADLQSKIPDAKPRTAKIYQDKIADLQEKNRAWAEEAATQDTDTIAYARSKYMEGLKDLHDFINTGSIKAAVDKAREQIPEEEKAPAPAQPGEDTLPEGPVKEGEPAPEEVVKNPSTAETPAQGRPIEDQRAFIESEVTKRMTAAGRPLEEAQAVAQLESTRYEALAKAYPKFTVEEWYNRDAANIKGGGESATAKGSLSYHAGSGSGRRTLKLFNGANPTTIIHEKGHEWTEQLIRLSEEDDAPTQMKADAKALKDYAEENKGRGKKVDRYGITTSGHESLARAMERYFVDGVAPTQRLHEVFAKFKSWMSAIYDAVKKTPAPINENVKAVFDRMFSTGDEPNVVPDTDMTGKLADVQEKETASVPPAHADSMGDSIENYIDMRVQHLGPEIENAIKSAEQSAKTGGVAGTAPGDTGVSSAAGAEPAGAAKSGAIPAGGGGSAPEGTPGGSAAGAGTEPGSSGGTGSGGDETGNAPAAVGRPDESVKPATVKDVMGNIRLDNWNGDEDIKQFGRDLAAASNDFMTNRGGVISDFQREKMAQALGLTVENFQPRVPEGVSASVWAEAVQKLAFEAVTAATEAAVNYRGKNTLENLAAMTEAESRANLIVGHFSTVTAEFGRTGRVFRKEAINKLKEYDDIVELLQKENNDLPLNKIALKAKLLAALKDQPGAAAKFLQAGKKPGFGAGLLEYFTCNLISGLKTHSTYAVGNQLMTAWKVTVDTAGAATMAKVNELLGRESSGITYREIPAGVKGMIHGYSPAAKSALESLKTGRTGILKGEESAKTPYSQEDGVPVNQPVIPNEMSNPAESFTHIGVDVLKSMVQKVVDLPMNTFSLFKGIGEGFITMGTLAKEGLTGDAPLLKLVGSDLGVIPDIHIKGMNLIPLGNVIRSDTRLIAAIHSFYKTVNASAEKSQLAYRKALGEGLTGDDFVARVGDLVVNTPDDMMQKVIDSANDASLMGQAGKFTQYLSLLLNMEYDLPLLGPTRLLKFIDPFAKVSAAIVRESVLKRSPFGFFLSQAVRDDLTGVNGAEARDLAQGKMLMGTAFFGAIGHHVASGRMTGSGSSDPKLAALNRQMGKPPYSIEINGVWYNYHRLGSTGMLASVGADMYDVAHAIGHETGAKVVTMAMHAFAKNILDESSMRGPSELNKAAEDPDRYGEAYLRDFVSSFIPYSVGLGQEARTIDPYARQVRTVMDAIKDKVPYWSETLHPKYDIWGQPLRNAQSLGPQALSAIYEQEESKDPTSQRLLALGMGIAKVGNKINDIPLTDDQYDFYSMTAGRLIKLRLDQSINTPDFAAMPPGLQIKQIGDIVNGARDDARSAVLAKYATTPDDIMVKYNALQAKRYGAGTPITP